MEYTLRDVGKPMMNMMVDGPSKSEKYYPRVGFDINQVPEISSWEVGGEYLLILKVKEVGHTIEEHNGDGARECADFEILKVGVYKPEVDLYGDDVKKKLKIKD